jgi:hypothetical protein
MTSTIPNIQSFLNILVNQRDNVAAKHDANSVAKINTNAANSIDTFTLSPTLNALQQFLSMNDANDNNGQEELSMSSLEQLKQQGEMLANMLQMKLKGFESDLLSSIKKAGIDQVAPMDIKDVDGLNITNDAPNKQAIQNLLQGNGKFKEQFQEIARLATLINTVQQLGNNNVQNNVLSEAGAKYAQFSKQNSNNINNPRRNESDFTLRILESNSSSMF